MVPPIQIVPAIKRLSLTCIGCWDHLILDFSPFLNIITGMGGCGKSIILQYILQGVHSLDADQYYLMPTHPFTTGRIGIEFYKRSVIVDIPGLNGIPEKPVNESYGQFMLTYLRYCLSVSPQGMAFLIEDEMTSVLDDMLYPQALELINNATSQIICIIGRRFSLKDFPNARAYKCYYPNTEDIAQIKRLSSGRA
jgi:hypothetical protein